MNAVSDPITQMRRQEQSLPVMKEGIPDLSLPMMKHEAGSSDKEEEVAPPAPISGRPRGRRRQEPKKKDNTPIDIP